MVLTIRHSTDHCNSRFISPTQHYYPFFCPQQPLTPPEMRVKIIVPGPATWLLLYTLGQTHSFSTWFSPFVHFSIATVICFSKKKRLPWRSLSIEEGLDFFLISFEWCQNGFSDRMVSALIRDGLMMGRFGHTLELSISWRRRWFFEEKDEEEAEEAASNPKWFIFWLICI